MNREHPATLPAPPTPSAGAGDGAAAVHEGLIHHAAGRLAVAATCYSAALDARPDDSDAWRLLGVVALQTGEIAAARSLLTTALHYAPSDAAALSALGDVEESAGNGAAARAAYDAALELDPYSAAAASGATRAALAAGDSAAALAVAEAAVARGLSDPALLRALAAARLAVRDYAGAAGVCRAALEAQPHADAYANLGAAEIHAHRVDAAIAACQAAIAHNPRHSTAANTLGIALKAEGNLPAALAAFERAAELGCDGAHINVGTTRLLLGDYLAAWPEYGWETPERRRNALYGRLPLWDGSPLAGRRLLIWPEQGIGDTLQLVRFVAAARRAGGSVTLACPPGTLDLLRDVGGADAAIDASMVPDATGFDVWVPTLSLPGVLGVTPDAIPSAPYLRADPTRLERLRPLLGDAQTLRIGLVWSGNPDFEWNDVRSCGLAALEPLSEIPNISFFGLQHGAARHERMHARLPIVPLDAHIRDFADTAAIVAQLDLVITVDTSVAHLVGALGRPGWVLLSNRPDWRWLRHGATTPWYPSLRLFRQDDDGAWPAVIARVATALRVFAQELKR